MCAAITSAALAVGMAGYQVYQGEKQKKDAKAALKNYKRQDLDNAFEDVKISTLGSDLMREESQRNNADMISTLSNAGSRSILGGIPKLSSITNSLNREAQIDIDNQVMRREYAIAGDNVGTRNMQESREINDLAGIGNAIQVGQQNSWNGIRGIGAGISYGLREGNFGLKTNKLDADGNPIKGADGKNIRVPTGSWSDQQRRKDYEYYNGGY